MGRSTGDIKAWEETFYGWDVTNKICREKMTVKRNVFQFLLNGFGLHLNANNIVLITTQCILFVLSIDIGPNRHKGGATVRTAIAT